MFHASQILANLVLGVGALAWLRGRLGGVGFAALAIATLVAGLIVGQWNAFGLMRLSCAVLYIHLPLMILVQYRWKGLAPALALVGVGVDAFFVEPTALEVNHLTLRSPKLTRPLRLALVADIQTDEVGAYEERALAAVAAEQPDLVLFAGDYIQAEATVEVELEPRLRALMLQHLAALPIAAVEGDFEGRGWQGLFLGLQATTDGQLRHGEVVVTLLDRQGSRTPPKIEAESAFHIVLGHSPDFSLARPPADLLLAGHVHGGQVRLPFFGPLITLTKVPRDQAVGHTRLDWGADLVVSRGVGLERGQAPRLRFLCRPEIVIIDLEPGLSPG